MLVISGFIMWLPDFFPQFLVRWAYPMHNIGFGLAAAVVIGHIYLSIGHPNSRVSMQGMTKGYVPEWYAEEHHGQWYEDLKNRRKKQAETQDAQVKTGSFPISWDICPFYGSFRHVDNIGGVLPGNVRVAFPLY